MTHSNQAFDERWQKALIHAKRNPGAFVGNQLTANYNAISRTIALVWKAKAFRAPVSTTIHLSPTQYVVVCYAGALLEHENYDSETEKSWPEWKKCFSDNIDPKLAGPTYPAILAKWLGVAYRTSAGFWCQTFQDGWPQTKPYLIQKTSPVGLFAAAALNPEWFTGLPFNHDDVSLLSNEPHVTVVWHPQDELIETLSQDPTELEKWL
jgi:hypothetical protein